MKQKRWLIQSCYFLLVSVLLISFVSAGNVTFKEGELIVDNDLTINNSVLFVNSTSGLIGIGSSAPENQLQISSDVGGVQRGLVISQHSENVATPIFLMKKSRGTLDSPVNLNGGEYLGSVFGSGYVDDEYQLYGGFGWATRSGSVSGDNVQTDLVFTASETPISSVTSDEKMRLTYEGYLGIGTSDPTYPLTVFGNVSTISIWSDGNISATGYLTRTSVYEEKDDKDALDWIKDADDYLDGSNNIDHSKFYGYVGDYPIVDMSRPEIIEIDGEEIITYPYTKDVGHVDLGKEIDVLRQSVYELSNELCSYDNKYSWC